MSLDLEVARKALEGDSKQSSEASEPRRAQPVGGKPEQEDAQLQEVRIVGSQGEVVTSVPLAELLAMDLDSAAR